MNRKYTFTDEVNGLKLHRIVALRDISRHGVKAGDLGGFLESESNLSQEGDCWVSENASVYGRARVSGNAHVHGNAEVLGDVRIFENSEVSGRAGIYGSASVYGNAKVSGRAYIHGNAEIFGNTKVSRNADVFGNASITGNAEINFLEDYIVFQKHWGYGGFITWTRSNNMFSMPPFYGTGEAMLSEMEKDREPVKEYKRVVDYVESVLNS